MSNGGRGAREAFISKIEASDPALYADLLALRSRDPQGFRKRIRTLSGRDGEAINMLVRLDLTDGYAGRAPDPSLAGRVDAVENARSQVAMPSTADLFKAAANAEVTAGASEDAIQAKKPSKAKGAKGDGVSRDNVNVKAEDTTAEATAPIGLSAAPPPVVDEDAEKPKKGARKKKAE